MMAAGGVNRIATAGGVVVEISQATKSGGLAKKLVLKDANLTVLQAVTSTTSSKKYIQFKDKTHSTIRKLEASTVLISRLASEGKLTLKFPESGEFIFIKASPSACMSLKNAIVDVPPDQQQRVTGNHAHRPATTAGVQGRPPEGTGRVEKSARSPLGTLPHHNLDGLTSLQLKAVELVRSGRSVFITGGAGVGKSYLISDVLTQMYNALGSKIVAVTASTGMAAMQLGGVTLHRFAGMRSASLDLQRVYADISKSPAAVQRWKSTSLLFVDEVSMIDGRLFDILDRIARKLRATPHLPFGGIQLVLSGDFLQLPPVPQPRTHVPVQPSRPVTAAPVPVTASKKSHSTVECKTGTGTVNAQGAVSSAGTATVSTGGNENGTRLNEYLWNESLEYFTREQQSVSELTDGRCKSVMSTRTAVSAISAASLSLREDRAPFAFEAMCWPKAVQHTIALTEVLRQKQSEFVSMLNSIRLGNCSEATARKLFARAPANSSRLYRKPSSNHQRSASISSAVANDNVRAITRLLALRKEVEAVNAAELLKLKTPETVFDATDLHHDTSIFGRLDLDKHTSPAERKLVLKEGCEVILVKTSDAARGLVNGCRGRVESIDPLTGRVKVFWNHLGFSTVVARSRFVVKWGGRIIASRDQLPLNHAWAVSIHKSQGLTLFAAEVNFTNIFEAGQAYVALSRAQRFEHLYISGAHSWTEVQEKIKCDPTALEFYVTVARQQQKAAQQ
eukprot:Lankesteria_metandrocarpae@DN2328_c0_g1_i1.p1